jgi:hypothetical protein
LLKVRRSLHGVSPAADGEKFQRAGAVVHPGHGQAKPVARIKSKRSGQGLTADPMDAVLGQTALLPLFDKNLLFSQLEKGSKIPNP